MTSLEGQTIKGYELIDRLGGGGFGEVYRAQQSLLKREVAIKVILPQHANQPEFIRRFEIEAELVARLEHPFIVPLFDYWRDADGAFLVMRMLRGGSLEDMIDSGPMDVKLITQILDQIAGALSVAHRNGVVHRDLKPANILLDEDHNAYLADFGIAKDLGGATSAQTMEGLLTPNYAAPEQFRGDPISPRTDLYNLGLMLFEMLTGKPPFSGTLHEVIFKHVSEPLPAVVDLQPGLPTSVDDVLRRATAKDPEDRYPNALALAAAFKSALASASLIDTETSPELHESTELLDAITIVEDTDVLENPYKGLRAFREGDADDFFGRDELTNRLLGRLDVNNGGHPFLAVVGPSGSGKSSVVKAGLLPQLRQGALPASDNWFLTEMFPGAHPMAELEAALLRVAINPPDSLIRQLEEDEHGLLRALKRILPEDNEIELVLVIDQFEELFTQIEDEAQRVHFLNSLRTVLEDPKGRMRLIVTIRADFYDRPLQYEALGELMRQHTEVVLPLSAADLERAISGPAERAGVTLEGGLAQAIIDDVGEQPGALPLLQYALTELFERRQGRVLTLEAYTQIGGVTGALARRAEELYRNFDSAAQDATRQLFLRLVTLGEGTEDTRRRVRRTEVGDNPQLDKVITAYGQYRLLTFDRDPTTRGQTVEVAHEALIRTWERLRDWIENSREDLRIQRRLTAAAAEWIASGRNRDYLASGARLTQFEEWSQDTALTLNQDERAYLDISIQEETARRERDERIARRVQNLGRATAILGVMIVIAIIATIVVLNLASTAQGRANDAQTQVALAGDTLTPAQATLSIAQEVANAARLQADQAQALAGTAQVQLDNVGQTLTPAQVTAAAAQQVVDEAQSLAGTSQAEAFIVQGTSQALVENVGATLTPAQGTVSAAQNAAADAQNQASTAQANALDIQATADAQAAAVGATLTPQQSTVVAADALAGTAVADARQAQAAALAADIQAGTAQAIATSAQDLVEGIGATLTPQQATIAAAQNAAFEADSLAATAQRQVAEVGATLTPQQATIAAAGSLAGTAQVQAENAQRVAAAADILAGTAQAQVEGIGATLTPQQATIAAAQQEVAAADALAGTAQAQAILAQQQIDGIGQTLTPQQATIVAADSLAGTAIADALVAQDSAAQANDQASTAVADAQLVQIQAQADQATAQAQVEGIGATLTPQQATIDAAQFAASEADALAGTAQAQAILAQQQIEGVGQTLTPQQATIVAADSLAGTAIADALVAQDSADRANNQAGTAVADAQSIQIQALADQATARARVETVGETLTPQQATVDAAQLQIAEVGQTLTPQQATADAALAVVVTADALAGTAQAQLEGIGATLTPQAATIAAAQAQVERVGETLTPVQGTVVAARSEADSISLAVSAETALDNGNYDLGLALILEAIRLNPQLTQAQRLLNNVAFSSARLSIDNVSIAAFSPSNRILVTNDGTTLLAWNIDSREVVDRLEGHTGLITDVAFSANGQFLATASQDATAILWDVTRWPAGDRATVAHQFAAHGGAVNAVAFNPESTRLLTGSDDAQIIAWDVIGGTEIIRFNATFPVKDLRYAEGGRDFFSYSDASGTTIANLWNGANGNRLYAEERLVFTEFSPNNRNVFFGGINTPLQIYNAGNRNLVREFTRNFNWVNDTTTAAVFRPFTGAEVLIGLENTNGDNRLVLADVASGEVIRQFQGEGARRVTDLAFNNAGTLALSANGNLMVLWDVEKGAEIRRLTAHNDLIDSVEFSPDGSYALSRSRDGNLRIWDISSGDGAEQARIRVETQIATANYPGFHPIRNTVYAGVWIDIFEFSGLNGQQTSRVSTGAEIKNMLYHPNQGQAVSVLENVAILWNLDAGTQGLIDRFGNSNDLFSGSGAFSSGGDYLVLDGRNDLYVYETSTWSRVRNIPKPALDAGYIITGLAITPDGQFVIGSSGNPEEAEAPAGDIMVWQVENSQEVLRFPREHSRTINSLVLSKDGSTVLTASNDNTLIMWDLATGQVVKRFAGHTDDVNVGLFSPDPGNPFIISGSDDQTIILWDIDSGQPLRRYRGTREPVTGLALSNDGRRMISTTGSDMIVLWRIESPQQVIDWVLDNRFVPRFTPDECSQYNVTDCNAQLVVPTRLPILPTQPFIPTTTALVTVDNDVTPTAVPENLKSFATNTGSFNVNVRSSDSTQARVVDVLRVGERVEVLGQSSRGTGWYQILLADGRLAWVSGTVVTLDGNVAGIPQIDPPPVVAPPSQPTARPSTGGNNTGGSTGGSTGGTTDATEEPAFNCSAFRITSPIGYVNNGPTTFYWDPLPGVPNANYWVTVWNDQGQQVGIADAGNGTSATIDLSVGTVGGGFTFSYQVNVFVNGETVCPATGSVGQRPAS